MKDRFKFRAVMKTDELCIVVPVEAVHSTYYIIDTNAAKEIFDKKYPEKCFFSDFLEIIEKQGYVSQYSFDCDLLITKDFTNLMQSTGLKNKNGKLIFEGNLIQINNEVFVVIYWRGEFTAESLNTSRRQEERQHFNWYNFCYPNNQPIIPEIIGNIYENPELLKGGKND